MDIKTRIKLLTDLQTVLQSHPTLSVKYFDGLPRILYGKYVVYDNHHVSQGEYEISIIVPEKYPHGFPTLYERSRNIPRDINRHIAENGEACVEIQQRRLIRANRGISISQFMDEYVHRYFCWQLLYDLRGAEGLSDWPHFDAGTFQYYFEVLGTLSKTDVQAWLLRLLADDKPEPSSLCPCHSGKRFEYCHQMVFSELRLIGFDQLFEDYLTFQTGTSFSLGRTITGKLTTQHTNLYDGRLPNPFKPLVSIPKL